MKRSAAKSTRNNLFLSDIEVSSAYQARASNSGAERRLRRLLYLRDIAALVLAELELQAGRAWSGARWGAQVGLASRIARASRELQRAREAVRMQRARIVTARMAAVRGDAWRLTVFPLPGPQLSLPFRCGSWRQGVRP